MAYANVKDTIFTGATGRELRRHPATVREVQFWLTCGPGRDPFGIFPFEPALVAPQLGAGRTLKHILEAVEVLDGLDFCHWDPQSQYVWVVEMAHHQFLTPLKLVDNRCRTAQKWYRELPRNPFLGPWFDRYELDFHLAAGDGAVERREGSPSEGAGGGASKPLGRGVYCTAVPSLDLDGTSTEILAKPVPETAPVDARLKGPDLDFQFDRLWAAYPNATERKVCLAKFATLKPTIRLVDEMLAAITIQRAGEQWVSGFIPKLANWIGNGRWQDKVADTSRLTPKNAGTVGAAKRFAERRREQSS